MTTYLFQPLALRLLVQYSETHMSHAKEQTDSIHGGFLQNGGDHPGPQIRVRAEELVKPKLIPETTGNDRKGGRNQFATLGVRFAHISSTDPTYRSMMKTAKAFRKACVTEFGQIHGTVGVGVASFLTHAARAHAAAVYLYEKAGEEMDLMEKMKLFQTAAKLADSSRQHHLAAWEMCAREAVIRRKLQAADNGLPWLEAKDSDTPVNRGGRPRREAKMEGEEKFTGTIVTDPRNEVQRAGDDDHG